jgi:hypothetical protein
MQLAEHGVDLWIHDGLSYQRQRTVRHSKGLLQTLRLYARNAAHLIDELLVQLYGLFYYELW